MTERLDVFRALDGYGRLGNLGVFDRLTQGRTDASGAYTQGCGLSPAQAATIVAFLNAGKGNAISKRFRLVEALERTDVGEGKTAWDVVLQMYAELPEPKNIAFLLDDICTAMEPRQ